MCRIFVHSLLLTIYSFCDTLFLIRDFFEFDGRSDRFLYKESLFVKEWYKPGEVGKLLGISTRTVQDYDRRGQLVFDRTETGRRLVSRERLLAYLDSQNMLMRDSENNRRDVIYARVSSNDQKQHGDLDRQAMFLIETCGSNLINPLVLKECGSGLNAKRTKVQKLIQMVMADEVRNVYITYRDRLTRFGFEYLETVFAVHGTNIIIVEKFDDEKSVEQELVEDLMSLMASFSEKLYGLRSHKAKRSVSIRDGVMKS